MYILLLSFNKYMTVHAMEHIKLTNIHFPIYFHVVYTGYTCVTTVVMLVGTHL